MQFTTRAARAGLILSVVLLAVSAAAQSKEPYEEYDKLISNKRAIATLGPQLFGDSVDLATGSLSFSTTDVSIAGNNSLPVAVTRTFRVTSEDSFSVGVFSDWEIDIPNISGLFAPNWHNDRCDRAAPYAGYGAGDGGGVVVFDPLHYWKNNTVQMPGGGEPLAIDASAARPSTGGPYKWITPARTVISCLGTSSSPSGSAVKNYTGQGFLAVAADGTKYWFDHMAQSEASSFQETVFNGEGSYATGTLIRKKNALYVTRVEDRFGNWVTYSYSNAYNENLRVDSITSSDGRSITLHYDGSGRIDSATAGGRTWTYQYTGYSLSAVVLPDGTRWTMALANFSQADIDYLFDSENPNWRNCKALMGALDSGAYTGSITHPSGAVGTFTVAPTLHGRSNVPLVCRNYQPGMYSPTADDIAVVPFKWHAISLTTKEISGHGLTPQTWAFSYTPGYSYQFPAGQTGPVCQSENCLERFCSSDECALSSTTTVVGPNAEWKRYTFGTSYRYNEGKLIKLEEGLDSSTVLRTTTKSYEMATSGRDYPVRIGTSSQPYGDGFVAEYPRPELSTVISQQDVVFTKTVDSACGAAPSYCFDSFLRPTRVRRFSSLGPSRTEMTAYFDQQARWVLGQVSTVTDLATGKVMSQTDYDATTALPLKNYSFGVLGHTLTYNADGTLASVTDGRNNVTSLAGWKRGLPQTITYPGAPATNRALVSDLGSLDWVEDELGYKTNYSYDVMDRMSSITYPTGDSVAWNATTTPFVAVPSVEYGIPAGHWKQTVQTGNGKTTTFYDAQWRPVLALSEDTGNASSRSFVVNRYDVAGRLVFTSYPVGSLSSIKDTLLGTTTEYDSLGRVTKALQDSELGVLTSTTAYLPGFQTRTTNPRGYATTTSYQVFDSPDTSRPVLIVAPEGVTTTITRDGFGKPLTVTRSGPGN